jgi:drug/metabolite transporter (DMT)-like permease
MAAVGLAFCASLLFGITDFAAGVASRRLGAFIVMLFSQLATILLLAVVAPVAGVSLPSAEFVALAAMSGIAQVIGVAAFWQAMTVGAMGVVAPISATGAAVPVIVGLVGGERPSVLQAVGIGTAMVGVVLVTYERRKAGEATSAEAAGGGKRVAKGVGLALIAAVGVGFLFTGLDAAAARGTLLSAVLVNRVASASVLCALALTRLGSLSVSRRDLGLMAGIGVMEICGIFIFAAATTHGLLSVVGVIGALYPVTTIVLARVFLKERLGLTQRVGAGAALAGVAAIAGG